MPVRANVSNSKIAILAYAAGVIDGEGCISISADLYRQRTASTTIPYHSLQVDVANIDRRLPEFMCRHFGGSIMQGARPNRKPYYRWAIRSKAAEAFLRLVYPFLAIKKEQADIAFRFRKTFGNSGRIITPERLAERTILRQDLMMLKRSDCHTSLV